MIRLIDLRGRDPYTGECPEKVRLGLTGESESPLKEFHGTLTTAGAMHSSCVSPPESEHEFTSVGIETKILPETFQPTIDFIRPLGSVPTFLGGTWHSSSNGEILLDRLALRYAGEERACEKRLAHGISVYVSDIQQLLQNSAIAAYNSDEERYFKENHTHYGRQNYRQY